jgi:hypothetical protein
MVNWTTNCAEGTYSFKVICNANNLQGVSEQITLTIDDGALPPSTSITIYGSQDLTGVGGYSGLSDYIAVDNNGHILIGCI